MIAVRAAAGLALARTGRRRGGRWPWGALAAAALPTVAFSALIVPLAVIAAADTAASDNLDAGCSVAGSGTTVAGIAVDAVQMARAQVIVTVAATSGLPPYAATVALATAWQESGLRMLANDGSSGQLTREQAAVTATSLSYAHDGVGHDHDSVNTFQQRWTAGWGTIAQLMDPGYAAEAFYRRLVEVPGWQGIPLTQAAQAVQVSANGAVYARWEPFARQLTAMLWPAAQTDSGVAGAVCPGLPAPAGSWIRPTAGVITSGFGTRWGSPHEGVDIAGPRGTPVYAAAAGTVVTAACTSTYCDRDGNLNLPGYGNLVELDHGGGVHTRYGHLTAYTVTVGQHVPAGALIGYQGATGNATGVHLHFEVRVDDVPVNPVPFMAQRGVDLSAHTAG
jgi:murein DD-endopeptidase MepM/ murein hydrolase activator NlpD